MKISNIAKMPIISRFNKTTPSYKNQNISFKDSFEKEMSKGLSKETFEKAKGWVMASILDKNPCESVVVVNNNEILQFAKGTNEDAEIKIGNEAIDPENNIAIIHSHIKINNNNEPPVSITDVQSLFDKEGINSIYAINSDGDYSLIERLPDKQYSIEKWVQLDNLYWQELENLFEGEEKENYRVLLKKYYKIFGSDIVDEEAEIEIAKQFNEFATQANSSKNYTPFVHQFWQKYAPMFDLKYETTYRYLK